LTFVSYANAPHKSMFENWGLVGFWTSIDGDFGVFPMFENQYDVCLHQKIIHNFQLKHKPQHGI